MSNHTKEETYFVVTFQDPKDGKVTTLNAKTIYDSPLGVGFVSISDFIFHTSSLVVNPEQEDLEKKFKNTKSLHLSLYNVMTIEEVGESNLGMNLRQDRSNLHIIKSASAPSEQPQN